MARQLSNSPELTDAQKAQFDVKVENYRQGVQRIHDKYWSDLKFDYSPGVRMITVDAGRYIRIFAVEQIWADQHDHTKGIGGDAMMDMGGKQVQKRQIHTFLDKLTGDVLKPASWKAPAKIARGNLFDELNGLRTVNHFGPGYLR